MCPGAGVHSGKMEQGICIDRDKRLFRCYRTGFPSVNSHEFDCSKRSLGGLAAWPLAQIARHRSSSGKLRPIVAQGDLTSPKGESCDVRLLYSDRRRNHAPLPACHIDPLYSGYYRLDSEFGKTPSTPQVLGRPNMYRTADARRLGTSRIRTILSAFLYNLAGIDESCPRRLCRVSGLAEQAGQRLTRPLRLFYIAGHATTSSRPDTLSDTDAR